MLLNRNPRALRPNPDALSRSRSEVGGIQQVLIESLSSSNVRSRGGAGCALHLPEAWVRKYPQPTAMFSFLWASAEVSGRPQTRRRATTAICTRSADSGTGDC